MTDAEVWLRTAVDQALEVGDPARYPELVGAAEALHACGAVGEEGTRAAVSRLDAAFSRALPVALPQAPALTSDAALRTVLAPMSSLGEALGLSVVLASVELWTTTVVVCLAGTGHASRGSDPGPGVASAVWAIPDRSELVERLPSQHQFGLISISVSLTDDVGTVYWEMGGLASGQPPWRAEHRFGPGVPLGASTLTITLAPGSSTTASVDLRLPDDL